MDNDLKEKLVKIGKGALIAGAGATITYLVEALPQVDFGNWTPLVVAFSSVFVNAVRKFLEK